MPPTQKKRVSAKKQGKNKKSSNKTQGDDSSEEQNAVDYVNSHKFTSKRFTKKLPATAQKLRQGTANAENTAWDIAKKSFYHDPEVPLLQTHMGETAHYDTILFDALCERAIPLPSHEQLCDDFREALKMNLIQCTLQCGDIFMDPQGSPKMSESMPDMDQSRKPIMMAFQDTCHMYEKRIASECYNGDIEVFRRACPNITDGHEFNVMLFQILSQRVDLTSGTIGKTALIQQDIKRAAEGVAEGVDEATSTCWVCKIVGKMKSCTRCKAARYCSRNCQVAAWKRGHKHACETLKGEYASYKANMAIVDTALANVDKHKQQYGIPASATVDYYMAEHCSFNDCWLPVERAPGVIGPSMEVFYQNLNRVLCGEMWIMDNGELLSASDPTTVVALATKPWQVPSEAEKNQVFHICKTLMYDYTGAQNPSNAFKIIHGGMLCGTNLESWRFLQMYLMSDSFDTKGIRERAKAKAFQLFHSHDASTRNPNTL